MESAFALGNRHIVDAGYASAHQAVLVEFPVLVAVAAEPVAAVIAPFVGKANGQSRPRRDYATGCQRYRPARRARDHGCSRRLRRDAPFGPQFQARKAETADV